VSVRDAFDKLLQVDTATAPTAVPQVFVGGLSVRDAFDKLLQVDTAAAPGSPPFSALRLDLSGLGPCSRPRFPRSRW
jgi:hypothetical protein